MEKQRRPNRFWLTTVAMTAALTVVAGCGAAPKVGDTGNVGNKVTVALQPTATSFPVWLAQRRGFFKDNGIDVELKYYPSGSAMSEAGVSGAWDAGNMGSPPALTGSQKWDLVVPGPNAEEGGLQIMWGRAAEFQRKDPAAALRRGKVLVKVNSTQHYALLGCLQKLGVADQVGRLPVEADAVAGAFSSGQGVAAMTWPPFDSEFVNSPDYVHVCDGEQAGIKIYNMLVLTSAFAQDRPEQAAAYVKSAYQANEFITTQPDKAAEQLVAFYNENGVTSSKQAAKRELAERSWPTAKETRALRAGRLANDLNDLADTFVELGAFDSKPDVAKAIQSGRDVLRAAIE